jgi:vancomycin resistance protein YoaR
VAIGAVLGAGLGVGAHSALPARPYVKGLYVGGQRLPNASEAATWLDARRADVKARPIILRAGDVEETLTFDDVGIDIDLEATLARAAEYGHSGSLVEQVKAAREARREQVDVPLVYRVSPAALDAALERLAQKVAKDPVDARLDIAQKSKIADVPGRALNLEMARAAVAAVDFDAVNAVTVDLPVDPVRAKVTTDDLATVDVTKVLSSWETTYATFGTGVGRSKNIARAAELIDGTIIPSGQVMSFNAIVGPRTLEHGFALAPEIQGDELTTGVGGGTCQVSSTLFHAAVFGALDIVERKSHSRVSSYIPMGLDATVSYPTVDLKLKNPFPFALMVHAFVPKPGVIRVELLGSDPPATVTYKYGVGGVEDFVRRITVKSNLKPGTRIRRQKGARGYDVNSVVTITWHDGRVEERTYYSGYRPSPEVFWVAPGYDEGELPPLPDHAKGVEGRLADGSAKTADDVYNTL